MKGIEIVNYGGPEVAKVRTFSSPVRRAGEVMIQVVASSINPVDIKYMTPETIQKIPSFPAILGWDIAGIIIEADKNSNFSAGERVVAFHPQGSWQQLVAASENQVVKLPDNIDFISGGSIPLAASTALQALRRLRLEPGERLLVTGAAGSVGYYALQFALKMGVKASGLVRNKNQKMSINLLDTEIYTNDDPIPEVDAVFDTAGVLNRIDVIHKGGRLVTISDEQIDPQVLKHTSFAEHNYVRVNKEDLEEIVHLVSEAKIETRVAKIYSFNNVQEALAQAIKSGNNGKVMLIF